MLSCKVVWSLQDLHLLLESVDELVWEVTLVLTQQLRPAFKVQALPPRPPHYTRG